jgi:hypothetical protein
MIRMRPLSMPAAAEYGSHAPISFDSGAAAHLADQFIAGKAVLHGPCLEPIDINRIGQVAQGLISQLRVPQAMQHFEHVLPAVLHGDHQAPGSQPTARPLAVSLTSMLPRVARE